MCLVPSLALAQATADDVEPLPIKVLPAAPLNREARQAQILVLHYSVVPLGDVVDMFTHGHVSAHYTVDRTGDIYQHVAEREAAHHAGRSFWHRPAVNRSAIGVEIVNRGPLDEERASARHRDPQESYEPLAWEPFAELQIQSVISLCQDIVASHNIDPFDVVGHADVAPQRKMDPGPNFFWLLLAEAGVGVAYDAREGVLVHGEERYPLELTRPRTVAQVQAELFSLGYAVPQHGTLDATTARVLLAFNSHYLGRFDSELTDETLAVLQALCRVRAERAAAAATADAALAHGA